MMKKMIGALVFTGVLALANGCANKETPAASTDFSQYRYSAWSGRGAGDALGMRMATQGESRGNVLVSAPKRTATPSYTPTPRDADIATVGQE